MPISFSPPSSLPCSPTLPLPIHLCPMSAAPSSRVLLPNSDSSNSLDSNHNNNNHSNKASSRLLNQQLQSKENSSPLLSSTNSNGFLSSTPSSKLLRSNNNNGGESRIFDHKQDATNEDHKGSWKSWKRGDGLQQWELDLINNPEVKRKANVAQLCEYPTCRTR